MLPTKIVVIGAGSASFGLNTLAALLRAERLRGGELALVDHNAQTLARVARLAERLNSQWGSRMRISTHSHHRAALEGAEFVVLSIEVAPREALWRQDYEIPLKCGVRQSYAENGGPGGFAHAARNIGPVLEIARDMEFACPEAWLINFTNPMTRICDAVNRYSRIKVVGLCHQIMAGYAMVGKALADDLGIQASEGFTSCHSDPQINPLRERMAALALERVEIQAAGLNHFTWMLALHDGQSGEDLYARFKERWEAMDPAFEPLTRRLYQAFGFFPISGDSHLCEYLPWVSNSRTRPWEKYNLRLYDWDAWEKLRDIGYGKIDRMGSGEIGIEELKEARSEGAVELIESIAGGRTQTHMAVNLPNLGQIVNLPPDAIVETPAVSDGAGVHGVSVGPLPETVAELCWRELAVVRLSVDAAVHGDRQAALQCLLLDPVIGDLDVAQQVLDDYLEAYRQYLPQFWRSK